MTHPAAAIAHAATGPAIAVTNAAAVFIQANAPRAFCHTCVAEFLGMTFTDAKEATTALRVRSGFVVEVGGTCDVCSTERVTIRRSASADHTDPRAV